MRGLSQYRSRWSSLRTREVRQTVIVVAQVVLGVAAGCLPGAGAGPALLPDDDAGGGFVSLGDSDGGFFRGDAALGDPFAIHGLSPSHGSFQGGTRSRIDGRGFSSKLRVYVGGKEIARTSILASDPTHAAINLPPGDPGFVDVRILDDATGRERVLENGFFYDAFVVLPDSGMTSGGTHISITGSGTTWGAGTTVAIGGVPCGEVAVASATKLECVTPVGTPGAKDVVVTTADGRPIQVRDAFTYSDSIDGYRGGLSGKALSGRLKVLAYESFTGRPISGAHVIAGDALGTAIKGETNANGVVEIPDVPGSLVTVTVAAKCYSPITFVDVPVENVTAYLDPTLESCIPKGEEDAGDAGEVPSTGGRYAGHIDGHLVFPGAREFDEGVWSTVPPPKPNERRAAYVFTPSPRATQTFQLPPAASAVTSTVGGTNEYSIVVYPGNATIYAIAGLEDRSARPEKFVPYAMGVARGVPVPAGSRVTGVDLKMDVLFDHQVTMIAEAPTSGSRGPDRFTGQVAMTLGAAGYAILPRGERTTALPTPGEIPFVGVPGLDRAMTGEQYILGGIADTGPSGQVPASVVTRVLTTNANTPVSLGGFLGVPVVAHPGNGAWSGTHVEFGGAIGPADLSIIDVASGSGVTWRIVAPGGRTSFEVPDLGAMTTAGRIGLVRGTITTTVYVARIEGFNYAELRYGHLSSSLWSAYAYDRLDGAY